MEDDGSSGWVPDTQMGDLDWVFGSKFWPGSGSAAEGIWEMNQGMGACSLALSAFQMKQMKKF